MKKITVLGACILFLSGCTSGVVDGHRYKTEFRAREGCVIDDQRARVLSGEKYADFLSPSHFKVTKLSDGNWQCRRATEGEYGKQREDQEDEKMADRLGITLIEYRKRESLKEEKRQQAILNHALAQERLYESYRKDGKMHVETYRYLDGSIKTISIHGNKRCESYTNATTSTFYCNY